MAKEPSRLQLAQEKVKLAKEKTDQKINELGDYTVILFANLTMIQSVIDNIRNVPEDNKLKYEELKAIQASWKQQADGIAEELKKAGVNTESSNISMGFTTTLGLASTGAALSTTLSSTLITKAVLGYIGGGFLLFGPVGWVIAGATSFTRFMILSKSKVDKERLENIYTLINTRDVKSYELATVELSERINRIKDESSKLVDAISKIAIFGTDYNAMTEAQQYELGAYVNLMESSTMLLINPILGLQPKYTKQDFDKLCDDGVKTPIFADLKETLLIDSESLRHYLKTDESLIITLANLLYKVALDEKDKEVLLKSLKKNKDFLVSVNISKGELTPFVLSVVEKALEYRYMY